MLLPHIDSWHWLCRERKKERDAELRQVLEGQTARMVELLDNHQKLQVQYCPIICQHFLSSFVQCAYIGSTCHCYAYLCMCGSAAASPHQIASPFVLQARVKELEHQLREKQVENVYLRGEISGLKNSSQPSHVSQEIDKDSK